MKKYRLIIGILFLTECGVNAQMLKPVPVTYIHNNVVQQKTFLQSVVTSTFDFNAILYSTAQPVFHFKYTLPHGAIFCRMEEALYSKLNFWVKLRMGTDERYSN